jgi:Zn-dependent protease with chaperone function
MSMVVCLLAYALSLAVLGPPLLSRVNRRGAAPRSGIWAWLAVMGTVLAAWLTAFGMLVRFVVTSGGRMPRAMAGCLAGLGLIVRGGYGELLQVGFLALGAMSTLAVLVLCARVVIALSRAHRGSKDHVRAAHIAAAYAAPGPGGALVVDSERRGVYCLAGPPQTIVMTRAALDALDSAELAAVLAHERAHLRGRHHQILALTAALSTMLPRVRLFNQGASEIARLLEMCADDSAARRHTPTSSSTLCLPSAFPIPARRRRYPPPLSVRPARASPSA